MNAVATFRQATRADVPAMQLIRKSVRENRLVSTVISDDQVIEAIETSGRGWVVEENNEIVGFGIANARQASIWSLFFHPDHEGKGHGSRVLRTMTEWLWNEGAECIWLSTDPGTRAEEFYRRQGWTVVGRLENGEVRFEKRKPDYPSSKSYIPDARSP